MVMRLFCLRKLALISISCKIMRDATPKSFVILDGVLEWHSPMVIFKECFTELGRGTSTYVSLAFRLIGPLIITPFYRMEWQSPG